jgi:predicted component of viral defense system (DUF524 family)
MESTGLRLRSRHRDVTVEVGVGACELAGEIEWVLSGPGEALDEIKNALGGMAERIGEALLLSFGNSVGFFDLPHLGRVEVVSGKWSRRDFDAMLANLTDIASALPFRGGEPAALPYDRSLSNRKDLLYSAFVYLRHVLSEDSALSDERLLPALNAVLADPHRRLVQERVLVSLERARGIDPRTLERLGSDSGPMTHAAGRQAETPVARMMRGRLPERVEESRSFSTLDTAENRFVKSFLQSADAILDQMEESCLQEKIPDPFAHRIVSECRYLRRRLAPILRHRMWEEVGSMIHLPASSTVLQRRRGYRQVFQCFSRLRLAARVPLNRELVRRLLESRNIAELYEIWCYFTMVRAVEKILGRPSWADSPSRRSTHLVIRQEFQVLWPDGTSLSYNRRFHPSSRSSYSALLRPDITLEIPKGDNAGLHLFDAKFRLDSLSRLLDEIGSGELSDDRGAFQKADLHKMHAYRDAIPEARSVWVLYPGTEARFFSTDFTTWDGAASPPEMPEGVGALPLIPGSQALVFLRQVLASVLGPAAT